MKNAEIVLRWNPSQRSGTMRPPANKSIAAARLINMEVLALLNVTLTGTAPD